MEDPHPPGSGEIACVPALKDSPSDREIVIQTVSSLARTKVLTVLPGRRFQGGKKLRFWGGERAQLLREILSLLFFDDISFLFQRERRNFFKFPTEPFSLLSEENPTLDLLRVRDHRCCLKRKYRKNRRTTLNVRDIV